MHGSILFLTLATVALGATVRLNSEGAMASAPEVASKNLMNSPSLAARNDLLTVTTSGGRKPIVVTLDGSKPILTSDGSSIVDTRGNGGGILGGNGGDILGGNGGGILGGNGVLLKKRNGSFLGLRRRDGGSLLNVAVNLGGQAQDGNTLQALTTSSDDQRGSDVLGVAQVDLSGKNPTVAVDLTHILGTTAGGAPCAEGLAAETANADNGLNVDVDVDVDLGQAGLTDVSGNNVAGNTIAANVDINGQPIEGNNGNGLIVDVNTQQPAAGAEGGNGVVAQQPVVAADNINASAVDVNANQPTANDNIGDVAANTGSPLATTPNDNIVDVTANTNTNDANAVNVDVNTNDGNVVNVAVDTEGTPVLNTDNVNLNAEDVTSGGDSSAAPKNEALIELNALTGKDTALLAIHPHPDHILDANLGKTAVTLKRRLYEVEKRQIQVLGNAITASTTDGEKDEVLAIDLNGSKGVTVLGTKVLDTKRPIVHRRNRDDDDEDEDEDEDEEEEEKVKESAVKDNKPKDSKDNHSAAEANNDKKEASKVEPEKHKNAASSGSSSNKIALLGAFVGAMFLMA
ncbi:unnamed protein product [Mortierella alpina]